MGDEDPWNDLFRDFSRTFTFTMDGETFNLFNQFHQPPPRRPKIEVVVVKINGLTLEVPLGNEEVDALIARGKKYEQDRRRKAEEAQRKREQDEYLENLRRKQQRRDEERARAREREEAFRRNENDWQNGPYGYGPGGSRFSGHDDGHRGQGAPDGFLGAQPLSQAVVIEKLAIFAEMSLPAARELPIKKLWRRAQRKCHPDTGGSHEKWLELHKLEGYLSK